MLHDQPSPRALSPKISSARPVLWLKPVRRIHKNDIRMNLRQNRRRATLATGPALRFPGNRRFFRESPSQPRGSAPRTTRDSSPRPQTPRSDRARPSIEIREHYAFNLRRQNVEYVFAQTVRRRRVSKPGRLSERGCGIRPPITRISADLPNQAVAALPVVANECDAPVAGRLPAGGIAPPKLAASLRAISRMSASRKNVADLQGRESGLLRSEETPPGPRSFMSISAI